MNKTLKHLSEEYYELINLGEITEDQFTLSEWICDQCPNKDIQIISTLWEGSADRLNNILDNMDDIDISKCDMTITDLIKDDIMYDDELSLNIKDIIFK